MEYIRITPSGSYIDGRRITEDMVPKREHKALEDWEDTTTRRGGLDDVYSYKWPKPDEGDRRFTVLGNDIQPYCISLVSDYIDLPTEWHWYACGDVKERVEMEFNETVAPAIKRDTPQVLSKSGRLFAHGLLDPQVDDFVWPRFLKNETPPCIEIKSATTMRMPITAHMPAIYETGKIAFECDMRYSKEGKLVKAECYIRRRQDWYVQVAVYGPGKAHAMKAERIG